MQQPELEHKYHEFRTFIGRDAEWIIQAPSGSEIRLRGPITRVICEIYPETRSGSWMLAVGWQAIMGKDTSLALGSAPMGSWRLIPNLQQEPREDRDLILARGVFEASEFVEQIDGTLVKRITCNSGSTELIIHKQGDNLDFESMLSP